MARNLTDLLKEKTGADYDKEIENIIYYADVMIKQLESTKGYLAKGTRELLAEALRLIVKAQYGSDI